MTNAEFFEKEKTSFDGVLRIFNDQKDNGFKSFDEFLNAKKSIWKYGIGNVIVLEHNEETEENGWHHEVVFKVLKQIQLVGCAPVYRLELLTPIFSRYSPTCDTGKLRNRIGSVHSLLAVFIERNSRKLFD